MPAQQIVTIECPTCKRSLPPGAMRCQFCGADLSRMVRPQAAVQVMRAQHKARSGALGWKEIAFQIVAGLWILNAAFEIIQGMGVIPAFMPVFGLKEYLVVMGVIDLILGIGLWVQHDLAMAVVKFRCILGLLNGFFGCLFAFALQDKPGLMIAMLLVGIFNLAFTGFQIYIISQFSD